VFGAVSDSAALIKAISALPAAPKAPVLPEALNGAPAATIGAVHGAAQLSCTVPAQPYDYALPLDKTALVMIGACAPLAG